MKTYLVTTALLFAMLTVAHIARVVEEGAALAREPWFIVVTIASTALCVWAIVLLVRSPRRQSLP